MLLEINGRATIAIASPEVASLRPPIWQINARPEAHKVTDRQFIAGASRDRQSDPFHAIAYLGHHKPVNAPE